LVGFLGLTLLLRILTDDRSPTDSHHSGSLNLSGVIAVVFILLAGALLLRRRRGVRITVLATLWLCVWTGVAVATHGASAETVREGVREAAVVGLASIVFNLRGFTASLAARMVQFVGFIPAVIALYQFATNSGDDIFGELRSYGTFAHPNSAAMFFAIAAVASLWCCLDAGRRRSDAVLVILFLLALLATFSIDGLITLVAMLLTFGSLRTGSVAARLLPCAIAAAVVLLFLATPLGSQRIARESGTSVAAAERGEANSSLGWRLHKWHTLLDEWQTHPVFGQGIGTTITTESIFGNDYAGEPPHNEYIRYLVETGAVGLILLLAALAVMVRALFSRRRLATAGDTESSKAATLALVVLAGCLVNSLADNTLLNSPTCYAAALIVAAVLAIPPPTRRRALAPTLRTDIAPQPL
jgi:O-antigen ligase